MLNLENCLPLFLCVLFSITLDNSSFSRECHHEWLQPVDPSRAPNDLSHVLCIFVHAHFQTKSKCENGVDFIFLVLILFSVVFFFVFFLNLPDQQAAALALQISPCWQIHLCHKGNTYVHNQKCKSAKWTCAFSILDLQRKLRGFRSKQLSLPLAFLSMRDAPCW